MAEVPEYCDCSNHEKKMRRRKISNGSIRYQSQCVNCGKGVGPQVSYSVASEHEITEWDEVLQKQYRDKWSGYNLKKKEEASKAEEEARIEKIKWRKNGF